uniref:trypsin-like serine protease n=1 Tax=Vibrio sp. TaxID=678 RepID=UPI003D11AA3F
PDDFTLYDVAKPKEISITANLLDLADENIKAENLFTVTHVVIHPEYNPLNTTSTDSNGFKMLETTAYQSDIALLYLDRDLSNTPIKLPDSSIYSELLALEDEWDPATRKENVTVAGWGDGEIGNSVPLVRTSIALLPLSECYTRLETAETLPKYIASSVDVTKLCTLPSEIIPVGDQLYGNGACVGDTGGPLLFERFNSDTGMNEVIQVGIISASPIINSVCSSATLPTWYTNVNTYLEWIDSYTSEALPPEEVIIKPDFMTADDQSQTDGSDGTDNTDSGSGGDNTTDGSTVVDECENNLTVVIDGVETVLGCDTTASTTASTDNGSGGGGLGMVGLMMLAFIRLFRQVSSLRH